MPNDARAAKEKAHEIITGCYDTNIRKLATALNDSIQI